MEATFNLQTLQIVVVNFILFFFGKEIGIEAVGTWFVLVVFNTLGWIRTREKYGTTIRRILEKQMTEVIMTFGLIFAINAITRPLNLEGLAWVIFITLSIRQVLFIVFKATQIFSVGNDLDPNNEITNWALQRIYAVLGDKLNIEATDVRKMMEQEPKKHHHKKHKNTQDSQDESGKMEEKTDNNQSNTDDDPGEGTS